MGVGYKLIGESQRRPRYPHILISSGLLFARFEDVTSTFASYPITHVPATSYRLWTHFRTILKTEQLLLGMEGFLWVQGNFSAWTGVRMIGIIPESLANDLIPTGSQLLSIRVRVWMEEKHKRYCGCHVRRLFKGLRRLFKGGRATLSTVSEDHGVQMPQIIPVNNYLSFDHTFELYTYQAFTAEGKYISLCSLYKKTNLMAYAQVRVCEIEKQMFKIIMLSDFTRDRLFKEGSCDSHEMSKTLK